MSLYSRFFARSTRKPSRTNCQSQPHRQMNRRQLHLESLESRQMLTFAPAIDFPAGVDPQAVIAADFNNDGRLDLVTSNPVDNGLRVLLGDGQGGFGAAATFPANVTAGADRASLATADFNGDGNLDVASVQHYQDAELYNHGDVRVLLGNGDGTFQPGFSAVGGKMSVAVGDFNADSHVDLVTSADDGNSFGVVQVLLGNGQGGFAAAAPYTMSSPAESLAVGDINGDGKLDAMALLNSGWTLLGKGDGTFVQPDPWYLYELDNTPGARQLALGDYTGDGTHDVVFVGETISVHRGIGDGLFDDPIDHTGHGSRQTAVATGDFNGDGRLDAVTSNADTGTLSEMLGNGDGTLAATSPCAVGLSPAAVAVGDFNGDGRLDAVTANAGSGTVSVLLNSGTWTAPPPSLAIGGASINEGNTGTRTMTFTVTRTGATHWTSTVAFATSNGTATGGSDYTATSGTLTFAPGETSKTISVLVKGDRLGEPNEAFVINLSHSTNATIVDGPGVGTIVDDEPRVSITDVSKSEGKKNQTTLFSFTVTLSAAYDQPVTLSFRTVDGTATASDNDYIAKTGTLTFAPGETTTTITIEVKGDSKKEATETFYLDLFGLSSNALFTKNRGIGTILNDD